MKGKTFDCVEMQHRGAEKINEQTSALSPEQEAAFWQERSLHLRQQQRNIQEKNPELEKETIIPSSPLVK